ncbi:uncharacterized protein LTR77_010154 [Saxophila tyrrhenica]|uniref:Beta-glucuronidase C-terminal domain-containing protein n=1 Tax=Saxophila tyrrhenica TaxID=1690608 RepID=A0AAV9NWL2_9PEZI|nr:hypothetical protein LTR77_010154 [Saxophila tyrrhenica]
MSKHFYLSIGLISLATTASAALTHDEEGPLLGADQGYGSEPHGWGQDDYEGCQEQHPGHARRQDAGSHIEVPSSTPADACPRVDPDFIGFAFEEASFVRYVQNDDGSVNQFSLNLIDAIMSRTGGKPIIRLGGTSPDYGRFIPSQEEPALPVAEVYNYQDIGGTSIGPSYWDLTDLVPDAVYVIQVPLAVTNVSESVLWAKTAIESIGIDRIQALEVGNEPDLYADNGPVGTRGLGPPYYQGTLTNETYTGNFTKYVRAIKAAIDDIPKKHFFQAFDTSSHLGADALATGYILDVETNFELGINKGNNIESVAGHYYQTDGGQYADLETGLMQHSAIANRLDLYRKFIVYLRDNHPKIPYIISEIGNSLNPTHAYDYQATLGSALWQVDLQLYAMTIGIARINWQQIMHSGYDMWLPVDSGNYTRTVYSNFYAMPFVADFIGKSGGATRAAQLETEQENIVAYAAFVRDKPKRVAIVNFDFWDQGDGARPSTTFTLEVPSGVKKVKVEVLSSPEGAHASGDSMTYAGSQWTSESEGKEVEGVRDDSQTLKVKKGKVDVEVFNSQAVLVHLR